jgi:hypothetical protein
MANPMDFPESDKMFLGAEMPAVIAQIRAAYPKHFALADRLNEFANRQLFTITIRKNQERDIRRNIVLAALLRRLLTAFQGTILVAERGMDSEVKLLVRKVLEVTFRVVAIARDEEAARLYILSDERARIKSLNKYQRLSESAKTPEAEPPEASLEALRVEVERRIKEENIAKVFTDYFAERANLSDTYNGAYAVLSTSVHANVRDLDSLIDSEDAGETVHLKYQPETDELSVLLHTACVGVLKSLEAALTVLGTEDPSPMASLCTELRGLADDDPTAHCPNPVEKRGS